MPIKNKLILTEDQFGNSDVGLDDPIDSYDDYDPNPRARPNDTYDYDNLDYKKAFDRAQTEQEKKKVINRFLLKFLRTAGIPTSKFKNIREKVVDQLYSFGSESLNELNNPFLRFIDKYAKKNDLAQMQAADYDNITHAYADGVINENTIVGKGQYGNDNIIFNPSMLKRSYEDFSYLCKAFSWIFGHKGVLSNYIDNCSQEALIRFADMLGNKELSADLTIPAENGGKGLEQAKADLKNNFIKEIMFDDRGNVRPARDIFRAMDFLDDQSAQSQNNNPNNNTTERDSLIARTPKNLSENEMNTVKNLNDEKARDIISYILQTHRGINI